jgi:protein O-mannosyl-transferase
MQARNRLLICIGLGFLTLVVFWPVTTFEFLRYDDPDFVTENPHVLNGLAREEIIWAFQSLYIYWQPLTWLSYMADVEVWGLTAKGFHLTSLLLHIASTSVLFLALSRMTGEQWPSAVVAGLFALHPLHIETVAWISDRKGVLSTVFWMLALLAYARYAARVNGRGPKVEHPGPHAAASLSPSPPFSLFSYALALLFFAMGLMSKSMVVTLPFVLLLLDYWPLGRLQENGMMRRLGRLVVEKIPFFALAAVSSFLTLKAQQQAQAIWSGEQMGLGMRVATALAGYATYLRKTFWPADLAVLYPHPGAWPWWVVLCSAMVVAGVSLAAWITRKKHPYIVVGWLWYLGTLVPVSGLLQTGEQATADRYTYIPLIGLFVALVWGGAALARRWKLPEAAQGVAALVALGACLLTTGFQLSFWQNSGTLFARAAAVTDRNYLAHAVLGSLMAEEGRYAEALEHYNLSLSFHPNYPDTHSGLADAHLRFRNFDKAIEHYQKAISVKPTFAAYHLKLARAFEMAGHIEEAIAAYEEALRIQPNAPEAHLVAGNLCLARGRFIDALKHYRAAVQAKPDWPDALNRLAWLLATHGEESVRNGAEALQLATRACELTNYQRPDALNALAAAYAENGRFAEAVQTSQRAIDLANAAGQGQLATIIQKLQEQYKAGQPYREGVQ